MSKKTNAEKQKRRHFRKPRKHQYKGQGRKNPAFELIACPPSGNLFDDPIFLFSLGQTILRALQVTGHMPPLPPLATDEVDAEFIEPEDTIQ